MHNIILQEENAGANGHHSPLLSHIEIPNSIRISVGRQTWVNKAHSQNWAGVLLEWRPVMQVEGTWDCGSCPCTWQSLELDELQGLFQPSSTVLCSQPTVLTEWRIYENKRTEKYGECISKIAALFTKTPGKWHKPDVKLHTRFSSKAPAESLRSGFSVLTTQNHLQVLLQVLLLMQNLFPPNTLPFRAQGKVSAFDSFVVCICLCHHLPTQMKSLGNTILLSALPRLILAPHEITDLKNPDF